MRLIPCILLILCFSCKEHKPKTILLQVEECLSLHEDVRRELLKYISRDSMWSADTVDLKNKCYLIEFYNGNLNSIITQKDTFVFFSYILCQQDYQGYKGVLKIENRFIAIFDNKDVGDSYYCRDSLLHIPLNQLPCVFEKFLIRKSFKIVNNSIRQFGGIANDE